MTANGAGSGAPGAGEQDERLGRLGDEGPDGGAQQLGRGALPPTDSGLLAKVVRRITATGRRIQAAPGAARTRLRDRSRAAGKRAPGIAAKLRLRAGQGRDEAQATVQRITGELADLAEHAARDAERLLSNARRALRGAQAKAADLAATGGGDAAASPGRGRLHRAVNDLTGLLEVTRRIAARPASASPGPRTAPGVGSACTIAKGRLGKPVEFGYKAQVVDNDDGVVLDHTASQGNPPDAPQLAPAVERVTARTGGRPRTVTADRGHGGERFEDALHRLGVCNVVIPRKGKPGKARQAFEHRPAFPRTVKWRTGCEGRISSLKGGYGMDRSRLDGIQGARAWAGQAVPGAEPGQDRGTGCLIGDPVKINERLGSDAYPRWTVDTTISGRSSYARSGTSPGTGGPFGAAGSPARVTSRWRDGR